MNDMRAVIVPKSDQINADDLLGGPMTITVTKVEIRPGTEQPVSIHFEGDKGKPYKPCKSMARVMVHCWGPDASQYVGRSMTLYCDPKVMWGGLAVGGIRISHLSHLDATQTMALTATKGSRKPFTVKPLAQGSSQPKRRTLIEWGADFETEMAHLETTAAIEDRIAQEDVQKLLSSETTKQHIKDRINEITRAALGRVRIADEVAAGRDGEGRALGETAEG